MPIVYDVFLDGRLVIERLTGDIAHDEIVRHMERRLRIPSLKPGAVVLADAREARFPETSPEMVRDLAVCYENAPGDVAIRKVAQIVSDEVWDRAKLHEQNAEVHGVTIISFQTFDAACTWLSVDLGIEETEIVRFLAAVQV